jgi:hypothetical protein
MDVLSPSLCGHLKQHADAVPPKIIADIGAGLETPMTMADANM